MEQLGWPQIGQHQLQQDVTHGLSFVLVDGGDNELDFADLIGVFLLDGYGIFYACLLPEQYETMTNRPPLVPRSVGAVRKVLLDLFLNSNVVEWVKNMIAHFLSTKPG